MTRETKLVKKLLADGEKQAENIVIESQKQAEDIISNAKIKEDEYLNEQLKIVNNEQKNRIEIAKSISFIDKNKIFLQAQNELVDQVFDLTLQKLREMKATEYTKFLKNILKFAEKGDKLIISSNKGEKEKIQKLDAYKDKKLSILEVSDKISGGVIIVGEKYDQDFSFESLVKEKKEKSLIQVSKLLF